MDKDTNYVSEHRPKFLFDQEVNFQTIWKVSDLLYHYLTLLYHVIIISLQPCPGAKAERYMHTHYTRDVIAEDMHRRLLQIYHMVFRSRDISNSQDHDLL